MLDIKCNMKLDKATEDIKIRQEEVMYSKKIQEKENRKHFIFRSIIIVFIALISIYAFTHNKYFYFLVGCFLIVSLIFISMSCYDEYNPEVDKRYYNRIQLIKLLSTAELVELKKNLLSYTINDDPMKVIHKFRLIGFSYMESKNIENITIDIDNFIIYIPYVVN